MPQNFPDSKTSLRTDPLPGAVPLSQNILNFTEWMRSRQIEQLGRILEGVKAGLIDPNEALVQGTPGGKLFSTYMGAQPPEPVRTEPQTVDIGPTDTGPGHLAARENLVKSGLLPSGKTTGGFQPATIEQLQRHVISQSVKGKPVPNSLAALSGLLKTRAQEELYDPKIAQALQKIRSDPQLLNSYVKMRIAFPDASEEALTQRVIGMGQLPATEAHYLGPSIQQQRIFSREDINKKILEAKDKSLEQQLKTAREIATMKVDSADRKIEAAKSMNNSNLYNKLISTLWPDIGENAILVANALVLEGADMEDLPDSIRDAVRKATSGRERLLNAKALALESLSTHRQNSDELARIRINQQAEYIEARISNMLERAEFNTANQNLRTELSAINTMFKNPSRRSQASTAFEQLAKHRLNYALEDAPGVWAAVSGPLGKLLGFPDWGKNLVPTEAGPKSPSAPQFNVPRLIPRAPRQPRPLSPEAEKFLRKYPNFLGSGK